VFTTPPLKVAGVCSRKQLVTASPRLCEVGWLMGYIIQTRNFTCMCSHTFYLPLSILDYFTRNLFNWLWPHTLQCQLDDFVEYWNNHQIQSQPKKLNVSGTTPCHTFTVPESYGGQDARITIHKEVIDALWATIPVSREDVMWWVDDEFAEWAQVAYEAIGSPTMVPLSGWTIFDNIVHLL
jgi:hypothetical protein